ncbi:hypothetical protein N9112_00360 [bacterium]|nr:hypothetical protein [bacterium]
MSLNYEYVYTVTGWKTASELADGEQEYAVSKSKLKEIFLRCSMSNARVTNFYILTYMVRGKVKLSREFSTIDAARDAFQRIVVTEKLEHGLFNPQ